MPGTDDVVGANGVRDTINRLVADVNDLQRAQAQIAQAHALMAQAQTEYQLRVSEFMLRNDRGREEMNKKLDTLITSDEQWRGARMAFQLSWKFVLGVAALVGVWVAYLTLKQHV